MSADALDHLSDAEKTVLRISLPTDDEVIIGWATPLLDLTPAQKALAVAAQVEVLTGLWDDPLAWCAKALKLAWRERDAH